MLNLIDHLDLSGTRSVREIAVARIGRDHLPARAKGITTAHHSERAVLGTLLSARNRRVDKIETALLGFSVKVARDLCGSSSVIDYDCTVVRPSKNAGLAEYDLAQIVADPRLPALASGNRQPAVCALSGCALQRWFGPCRVWTMRLVSLRLIASEEAALRGLDLVVATGSAFVGDRQPLGLW
jgi:hypothetical protein